jgi:hypothetical protein
VPSGSTPPAKRPTSVCLIFLYSIFFVAARFHSEYFSFPHNSSSSSTATVTGIAAPAPGTTAVMVAFGVAPGPAVGGIPQTPKGVPEDVLEESEEEPVPEEVPVEGPMIAVRAAAPSPPCGESAVTSSAPRAAAATGAAASAVVGPEMILGTPPSTRRAIFPWMRP